MALYKCVYYYYYYYYFLTYEGVPKIQDCVVVL